MNINERGFWENETPEGHLHDEGLAESIYQFLKKEKVEGIFDIGCGDGYYTKYLNDRGIFSIPIDGNPHTAEFLANSLLFVVDLSKPIGSLFSPTDWAICLEVGEHIPQEYEEVFFDNIDKLNKKGIILSWAVKGQGGDGHVNCKDNDEVIKEMRRRGYNYDEAQTWKIRESAAMYPTPCYWFKQSLLVFRRR
jgi:hypothetical protein